MMPTKLSIVIVNYNTCDLVYNCLKSIKDNLKIDYEVILVENGSRKELRIKNEELSKILPASRYSLLVANDNIGFGRGNNLGAQKATGQYLLLLNPDTLLVDDSVQKMIDFLSKHEEIGALTALLYNDLKCQKLQKNFFGKFQTLAGLTIRRYNYQKIDFSKEFFYTDIVTGADLMISKNIFDKLSGFDEKIFMYLEDDDLCRRIVNSGYKNAVLNKAKIVHLEGKSSSNKEKKRYYYQSQDYYWHKHNGAFATMLMKIIRFPMKIIKTSK